MDQPGTDKQAVLSQLQREFSVSCVDFSKKDDNPEEFFENVALCDESVLNDYLNSGSIETDVIKELIASRELFPCFFGSALKMTGVKELLEAVTLYAKQPVYTKEFGARVFKIARDEQGARLTYMKLTGGILKNKELLSGGKDSENGRKRSIKSAFIPVKNIPHRRRCKPVWSVR